MKLESKKITTYNCLHKEFNYIAIDQSEKLYMEFKLLTYPYQKNQYNTGIWKINIKL